MDGPPRRLLLLLALAATTSGCATPVRIERLEAELRDQQDQLATQARALESLQNERDALRHQRDELLRKANSIVRPEQADLLARVEQLAINPWLTGGRDTDRQPGDDELVVMIQPRDGDGEPVKLPGTLQIRLTDPAAPADSRQLGTWDFTSEDCRKRWLASMLSRGFLFKLPWQTPPTHKRLLLHARFDTTDGRRFDADALIQVAPPSDPPRGPVQTAKESSDGG